MSEDLTKLKIFNEAIDEITELCKAFGNSVVISVTSEDKSEMYTNMAVEESEFPAILANQFYEFVKETSLKSGKPMWSEVGAPLLRSFSNQLLAFQKEMLEQEKMLDNPQGRA